MVFTFAVPVRIKKPQSHIQSATKVEGGKTYVSVKQQKLEQKVGKTKAAAIVAKRANPYKHLPVHVQ